MSIINSIIIFYNKKYPNCKCNYWNCSINYPELLNIKFNNFASYIKFIKLIQKTENQYYKIYNWLYRRLFINKSIKLLEYYYRPNNLGNIGHFS
jgi:hypothetical protein